jgi:uncharacterized repeat protein (TIGR01451 family)
MSVRQKPKSRFAALSVSFFLLALLFSPIMTEVGNASIVEPKILNPLYNINVYYVSSPSIAVDGNLNEAAWADPNTTVTTTGIFNGYNLTIKIFHNESYMFVGVEMWGDTNSHPNDFCEICFDPDNDGVTPPEPADLKLRAENSQAQDEYELSYGNGAGWTIFSNETGGPNPWPPGFAADAEMQSVATYELQIPVADVWGTTFPPQGITTGFIVHAHTQGTNKQHVWWPDNGYDGETPPIEYCDFPSGYGKVLYNGPPYIITASYVNAGTITIEGNMTEPAWSDPGTSLTQTLNISSGYNLTIRVFQNGSYLFVGVELLNDTAVNPQDICELAFDVNHNNITPPEASDWKVRATGTDINTNSYSLYNGSGAGWTQYSSQNNNPNPWPTSYLVNGTMSGNASYEFMLPVSAVWGTTNPPNGSTVGFIVHGLDKANNQHVWWPDQNGSGTNPPIEYCDNASCYGDLVFIAPPTLTPDHIEYVSGDDQNGTVNTTCSNPIIFTAHNQTHVPVYGANVNFTIYNAPGGATNYYFVESGQPWYNDVSDSNGLVSAVLHLGTKPGDYWVNVSSSTLPGNFGPTYNNTIKANASIGQADHLVNISGGGASAEVGQTVPALQARVVDQAGNSVPEARVWWNIKATPGGTGEWLTDNTSVSDANGLVSTNLTLGSLPGLYTVSCNATLPGIPDTIWYNSTATVGSVLNINYVSGDNQTGPTSSSLSPFLARITDQYGNNASNVTVWWEIAEKPSGAAGESLSNNMSVSNASGIVSTNLTLGDLPGWYNVTCNNSALTGVPNSYKYTSVATISILHLVYIIGDNQNVTVGEVSSPLRAKVVNESGYNISGVTVWWNVNPEPGSTGYFLSNNSSVSDANGLVETNLTLGDKPGWYTVTCENPMLLGIPKTIWFNMTCIIGPAHHLMYMSSGNPTGNVGTQVLHLAKVVDKFNNNVSWTEVLWTITGAPPLATGQNLSDTTSLSDTYGDVYTTLTLGNIPGQYKVTCANLSLAGEPSVLYFNTTATLLPSPTHLDMVSNLSEVIVQKTAALTIWLNDSFNNGYPGRTIDMSFDSNPSAPGASFETIWDKGDGSYICNYTAGQKAWVTDVIRATCGSLSDTVSINVLAGAPSNITYVSGNGQSKYVGEALDAPFLVRVNDTYGNPIPSVEINWTIDGWPAVATGQSLSVWNNVTNGSGIAGTYLRLGDKPGYYYVNATNQTLALFGEPISFSAVALTPRYNIIKISGDDQTSTAGTALPLPLVIEVRDNASTPRAGVEVWFNVTLGGGSASVTNPVLTGVNGRAQANLTLGVNAGLNAATAEISTPGINRATFNATGTLPNLLPSLSANQTSAQAGEIISYILFVDNNGTEAAKNVWVNDTLSSYLSYSGDNSGAVRTASGQDNTWFFSSIPVGSTVFVLSVEVSASAPNNTQISNSFTAEYYNHADGKMPIKVSNTFTITVITTTIVNIPPIIEGVPDLIIHYDWNYSIDLSVYITDPDTPSDDLYLVLSDNVHAKIPPYNNLAMILNYSEQYLNSTVTLNITVSDGKGSDWDLIDVTISDDFPPELISTLPDVTMNEDDVKYPFIISDYFLDRDGDALYYTVGELHINITILTNLTVRIIPDPNWFGIERVAFRATDPTGALLEDIIEITVLPVNDPPIIHDIPDQLGQAGVPWSLDVSPYLEDVDNSISELTIYVNSNKIDLTGPFMTFRYNETISLDIITITVSDGQAQSYGQINVTVEGSVVPADTGLPPWLVPLIVIIVVLLALLLIAARKKKALIEQVFLIYKDGALLAHATNRMIPDMDTQIFTSMFTAIQDFVKDSFKDEKNIGLSKLEFGDSKIAIERSKSGDVTLAMVYSGKGDEKKLKKTGNKILDDVDKEFGSTLNNWDGNLDNLRGARDLLTKHLEKV